MWESLRVCNPYMTGVPIKAPEDFFGRGLEIANLVERIQRGQSVVIVSPPRMGSTSLLNRLAQPDLRARLGPSPPFIAFIDCADLIHSPGDFYRRLARRIKARQPDLPLDPSVSDEALLAEQVSDVVAREDCRWVLLLDNFEALASFHARFFNHLRVWASRGAPLMVIGSRVPLHELGLATDRNASPFWTVIQPCPLGPWTVDEYDQFLATNSERSGVDLLAYRDTVLALAGTIPAFVQQVAAYFFEAALHGPVDVAAVSAEVKEVLRSTFEQIWSNLSQHDAEREILVAAAHGRLPSDNGQTAMAYASLVRSGFLNPNGTIASQLFADYLSHSLPRIVVSPDRREVVIEGEARTLPRRDYDLLFYLYGRAGAVCSTREILEHVWGYNLSNRGVGDDTMVYQRVRALRLAIEEDPRKPRHIQNVPGIGYRFVNYARGE